MAYLHVLACLYLGVIIAYTQKDSIRYLYSLFLGGNVFKNSFQNYWYSPNFLALTFSCICNFYSSFL